MYISEELKSINEIQESGGGARDMWSEDNHGWWHYLENCPVLLENGFRRKSQRPGWRQCTCFSAVRTYEFYRRHGMEVPRHDPRL